MMQTFFSPAARPHDITTDTSRSWLTKLVHILGGIYIHAIRTKQRFFTFESVKLRTWFSSMVEEPRAGILRDAHSVRQPKCMETQEDLSTCFPKTVKIPPLVTFL